MYNVHVYAYVTYCTCCVVKEVVSFWGLGQLLDVVRKRTYTGATDQQEECSL